MQLLVVVVFFVHKCARPRREVPNILLHMVGWAVMKLRIRGVHNLHQAQVSWNKEVWVAAVETDRVGVIRPPVPTTLAASEAKCRVLGPKALERVLCSLAPFYQPAAERLFVGDQQPKPVPLVEVPEDQLERFVGYGAEYHRPWAQLGVEFIYYGYGENVYLIS